ncbi:MAG TPA: hypothetical protein VNZ22_15735, partial [Bacillota bacterium]|nr:hypothetical protein [Bacillota bacterium]
NYGQDQSYRPAENPWLVDFDLRKLHDLGCNFGVGNLEMFYANRPQPRNTPEERDAEIDRFLAATVAFGHPGFLVMEGGLGHALRSYYMLQQLHSRYCLTNAAEIRYVAADGQLLDTSRAVASGAFQRSQVVTRYADGTVTAANGHRRERLRCEAFGRQLDLPPNGYAGWTADGTIEVLSTDLPPAPSAFPTPHSARPSRRADYAVTPAYLYVDGRGQFVRFPRAAGNGIGICRRLPQGQYEIILYQNAECGFAIRAASAVALDKDNKELGPAQLRTARGLTYVVPVKGAFSYQLSGATTSAEPNSARALPTTPEQPLLSCDRSEVIPGEQAVVQGRESHSFQVPADTKPGQRLWLEFEGGWIDFTVTTLADLQVELKGDALCFTLSSHLPQMEAFELQAASHTRQLRLAPNQTTLATVELGAVSAESTEILPIVLRAGSLSQRLELSLRTKRELAPVAAMPAQWTPGLALRGQQEITGLATAGVNLQPQLITCGEVSKPGLFMHPPWQGGVGYCFALYEPVTLPPGIPAAFRASV